MRQRRLTQSGPPSPLGWWRSRHGSENGLQDPLWNPGGARASENDKSQKFYVKFYKEMLKNPGQQNTENLILSLH